MIARLDRPEDDRTEPRHRWRPRRWWLALLALLLAVRPDPTVGQNPKGPVYQPPESLADPRLAGIRAAAIEWEKRPGPARAVVDQVCLVPDLATFFEAVATWDEAHYFPILIDDVETTFRFLRAFRPARIVRFPRAAAPIAPNRVWERAVGAVGAAWTGTDPTGPPGDTVPKGLGPTPPGVVLSAPGAPMLAGAVALAAGRFQPLRRVDFARRFTDKLTASDFRGFDNLVTAQVRAVAPDHGRLGDDCDFLTLAGDWPYGYGGPDGDATVEDGLGRQTATGQRWAFAGRLLGNPAQSVYRAMCSLFLQPNAAALFNGYDEQSQPWAGYSMRLAALRMASAKPTAHAAGAQATIAGWHELFDPENRFGLVLINSSGGPTAFTVVYGPGGVPDIPRTVPTAVLMIHSFSAITPLDPDTVAGRWLANGAFVYYGSMTEPYLDAFRTPRLVTDLLAQGLPLVAAVRTTLAEPRGTPWRLAFLGDPLYRLKPNGPPRQAQWEPLATWPAYTEATQPVVASESVVLQWATRTALRRLQAGQGGAGDDDVIEALLAIRRTRLPATSRPILDALLADLLFHANRRRDLHDYIAAIPEPERTTDLRRWFDTLLSIDLAGALARKDGTRARAVWAELIRVDRLAADFKGLATVRVALAIESPDALREWTDILRAALRERPRSPEAEAITAELKRIDEVSRQKPK